MVQRAAGSRPRGYVGSPADAGASTFRGPEVGYVTEVNAGGLCKVTVGGRTATGVLGRDIPVRAGDAVFVEALQGAEGGSYLVMGFATS